MTLNHKVMGLEKSGISRAIWESGWIKARAARRLSITERIIGYRIAKYGLGREVDKQYTSVTALRINKFN